MTEMARTFKGGPPAESEIVRDMKNLKFSDAPSKKKEVYTAFLDLVRGQTDSVESERGMVYGSLDPKTSLLSSKSQQIYNAIHGGTDPGLKPPFDAAATTGQPPANPATQQPVAPIGTVVKMKDGSTKTKTANGWQ
jgi:hypothetical protein